ncbi:hypothetical protein ACF0H5_002119 [Mactra antiquata]
MTIDEPASHKKEQDETDEDNVNNITNEVETALLGDTNSQQNDHEDGNKKDLVGIDSAVADDQPDKEKKLGIAYIINNVRTDRLYRQKFIHTVILWWSFIGLGWIVGMVGPTFPDLRQIINEDLATTSWMFPAGSFGYLVGSFFGGFLYDRFNKIVLLTLSTLGLGVTSIITPFCASLPWMLFIKFAGALTSGVLDVGGNAHLIFVWGQEGDSYMQALHFGFSLGASIAPYVTEPFLAKKIKTCQHIANMTTDRPSTDSSVSRMYNQSAPSTAILDMHYYNASADVPNHMTKCTEEYEATSVYIAYIIAGIIVLTSTVAFAFLHAHSRKNKLTKQVSGNEKKTDGTITRRKQLTRRMKVLYLVLLSILISSYCIVEDGFASYLMTFAIERLKWDKSTGSFATGLFWVSFGIGRFCGIFIIACCRTKLLLTLYLMMLGCGYAGFLLSAFFNVFPLIWIFTVVLGFSMSVIFPAIFSWTSENIITVSGKISSVFLTSASSSGMLTMFLIGNLMDKYDPMWFVYILVIVMGICLLTYAVLSATLRIHRNSNGDGKETTMDTSNKEQHDGTELTPI